MKICKLCGSTYGDRVEFCFRDGQPLEEAAAPDPEPSPADLPEPPSRAAPTSPMPRGRPSVADMLDVPEPGFARPVDPTALPDPVGLPEPAGLAPVTPAPAEELPDDDAQPPGDGALPDVETDGEPLPEEPDGTEEVEAPFEPVDEVGDEALAPPAALAPPEPTAPVPAPSSDGMQTIDHAADDAAEDDAGEEELPGPQELDEGMDAAALDEVSRALGGGSDDEDDEEAPAAAAPLSDEAEDLDHLAAAAASAPARPRPTPVEDIPYADDPPAEGGGNKSMMIGFGIALLVIIVGGGWLATRPDETPDPMAGKPAERAEPVRTAPAPTPAPTPPPQPVDAGADDGTATDDGATDDGATDDGAATDDGGTTGDAATTDDGGTPEPVAAPPVVPVREEPTATTPSPAREERPTTPSPAREERPVVVTPPTPVNEPVAEVSPSAGDPWGSSAASTGRLTINTVPAGATVFVGGRQLGRSPVTTDVSYGSHDIKVELAGHKGGARTVQVNAPEMAVPFELEPLMAQGTVNIFGPTGATVYVDGAEVGKIPTSVKLSEGAHRFKVVGTDGATFEHSQDVRFGGGSTVSVTLAPR